MTEPTPENKLMRLIIGNGGMLADDCDQTFRAFVDKYGSVEDALRELSQRERKDW